MPSSGRELDRSRRELLKLAAAGSTGIAAGLAGCGQDQQTEQTTTGDTTTTKSSNSDGSSDTDGPNLVDQPFVMPTNSVPSDVHFNPYNQANRARDIERVLFDPLTYYSPDSGEFYPVGASEWTLDSGALTISLNEDLDWHNGNPVRARDLATQFKLETATGGPIGDYVTELAANGEKELELTLADNVNPQVVLQDVLTKRILVRHEVFNPKLEAIESASGEEETKQAKTDLTKWKLQDAVGNGPFELVERTKQRATLKRYADHPSASNINFPSIHFNYLSSDQQVIQSILGNDVDGVFNLVPPGNSLRQPPHGWTHKLLPSYRGLSIAFQGKSETYGDRRVRQAIAHLIDPMPTLKVSAPFNNTTIEVPNLLGNVQTDQYIPDSDVEAFKNYDVNPEKAASLLQDAGYSKADGTWVDSSGNPLQAPIKYPAGWASWVSAAQNLVSQLNSAGIAAEAVGMENSAFFGNAINGANFELALFFWGTGNPYPYFNLNKHFGNPWIRENFGVPEEVTVPAYASSGGETMTVAVKDRVKELAKTAEESKARDIIKELAWVGNQDLPMYPLMQKQAPTWYTTADWSYPKRDDPKMSIRYPQSALLRLGGLQAAPE